MTDLYEPTIKETLRTQLDADVNSHDRLLSAAAETLVQGAHAPGYEAAFSALMSQQGPFSSDGMPMIEDVTVFLKPEITAVEISGVVRELFQRNGYELLDTSRVGEGKYIREDVSVRAHITFYGMFTSGKIPNMLKATVWDCTPSSNQTLSNRLD